MDRYKQLVDLAPDAIVVVRRDGTIDYANIETQKIFGYAPEDLVGVPHDCLVPERFRAAHARHMEEFLLRPQSRPMGRAMETFGLTKDGREIPVEVSLGVIGVSEGLLVATTIRDITQRKRLEDAARVGRDRLASALEAIRAHMRTRVLEYRDATSPQPAYRLPMPAILITATRPAK